MDQVNENDGKISKRGNKKKNRTKARATVPEKRNELICRLSEQTKMLLLLSILVNASNFAIFIDDLKKNKRHNRSANTRKRYKFSSNVWNAIFDTRKSLPFSS